MITDEDFLDFKCPHCTEQNSFPRDSAGLVRECVHCLESVIVPADGSNEGRALPLPVTTARLILRRFVAGDWQDLVGFMFDDEPDVLRWLENNAKVRLSDLNETFYLALEHRESGRVIGHVTLRLEDHSHRETEIQFQMREAAPDNDLAAEAIRGLLGFCFHGLGLHRAYARCRSSDSARCATYEQAGLRREGEFVKNFLADGQWCNTVWFGILEEEFTAATSSHP